MVGSATLVIVRSTIVMKYATASTAKARQRRTSPGAAASLWLTSFLRSSEVIPVSDARWSGPHLFRHQPRPERNGAGTAVLFRARRGHYLGRRKGRSRCEDAMETASTLARAQAGDQEAFRELTDPYRADLLAHCYPILGSMAGPRYAPGCTASPSTAA